MYFIDDLLISGFKYFALFSPKKESRPPMGTGIFLKPQIINIENSPALFSSFILF